MRRLIVAGLLAALATGVGVPAGHALPTGIASTVFGATGCPLCHAGGIAPDVLLSGPTSVAPGDTAEYTLTMFSNPAQNFGGFNVAVPLGTVSTGGPFALGTQTIAGALGLAEITHTAPKQGDFMNVIEFSFQWTAPPAYVSTTMRGWGNAVNLDGTPGGDAASLATLDVFSTTLDTPTARATPTPTPGVPLCGNAAPLHPPLVTDPAARACQAAIAKAGATYTKKDLKAVRACLAAVQSGAPSGDPLALCVGSAAVGPTDPPTAQAIGKAQDKARALLQSKCTDAAVAALDACAESESQLEDCTLAQHRQRVVEVIASQYGLVTPTEDKGEQKCQKAIGGAAAGYLLAHLRASQKCLLKRADAAQPLDGAALCIGGLVADGFVAPLDGKAAAAAAGAAAKMMQKVRDKCDDAQIAALSGCGGTLSDTLACLLCTHRTAVFDLLSDEFGGTP